MRTPNQNIHKHMKQILRDVWKTYKQQSKHTKASIENDANFGWKSIKNIWKLKQKHLDSLSKHVEPCKNT